MKYKYNIGIDARFILRQLRGIPLYVARLCEFIPELRRDCLFTLFINKGYEHNDQQKNYAIRIERIQDKNSNILFVNHDDDAEIFWEQVWLPKLAKQHHVDILHLPANRACFSASMPTVVTVHDTMECMYLAKRFLAGLRSTPYYFRLNFYQMRIAFYVWAIYRVGIKRAQRVISVSHFSANDIVKQLHIAPNKLSVIYHGLDDDFRCKSIRGQPLSTAERLGSEGYVLMLGGDSCQKNPQGAIAAWAKVPVEMRKKYRLRIIGFCGNGQSPLLKALKAHDLTNEVEIQGWVSDEELIFQFQNATLFLYLSRYEGFGFPPLHAMACGTPVVATDSSSIPEILGPVGLKFAPDDYCGIAKGIEQLLTDEIFYQKQVALGVERAEQFSWRKSAELHLETYKKILPGL